MVSTDGNIPPPDFSRIAIRVLKASGFTVPALGKAGVVVFNSQSWQALVGSAHDLLGIEERTRAARFRFDRDRSTYVLAHALWRVSLGICLGVDASEVRLTSSAEGQPRLPDTSWATSLSHSGQWVAVAMCEGATIGVDIELSPSHMALATLMPTICSPTEIAVHGALPEPEREAALLALWTRKEALLKAFGIGLDVDLSTLSVTAGELIAIPPSPTGAPRNPCRVVHPEWPAGVIGALAVPKPITGFRLCTVEIRPDL